MTGMSCTVELVAVGAQLRLVPRQVKRVGLGVGQFVARIACVDADRAVNDRVVADVGVALGAHAAAWPIASVGRATLVVAGIAAAALATRTRE
jgi:hypothetical protein